MALFSYKKYMVEFDEFVTLLYIVFDRYDLTFSIAHTLIQSVGPGKPGLIPSSVIIKLESSIIAEDIQQYYAKYIVTKNKFEWHYLFM